MRYGGGCGIVSDPMSGQEFFNANARLIVIGSGSAAAGGTATAGTMSAGAVMAAAANGSAGAPQVLSPNALALGFPDARWDIMPPKGLLPEPRCGHTLSLLGPIGPVPTATDISLMTASASASGGAAPFGGGSAAPAGSAGSNTSQAAAVAAAAAAAAQLGNRLVVAFGETAKNVPVHERKYFGDVFSFDGREWNQVKTDYKKDSYSPNERADHQAVAFGANRENLFFFGGRYKHSYLDDSFVLSGVCTGNARFVPIYSAVNPNGRRGHSITQLYASSNEEGLVLFGGERGNTYLQDLWHFDPVKLLWNPLRNKGDAPSARALHAAFSPARDLLMVLGGHDVHGVAPPDLFSYDLRTELLLLNPQAISNFYQINVDPKASSFGDCTTIPVRGKPPEPRVRLSSCIVHRDHTGLSHRVFVFGGWKKDANAQALSGGLRCLTITKAPDAKKDSKTANDVKADTPKSAEPVKRVKLSQTPVKCRPDAAPINQKFFVTATAALKPNGKLSASLKAPTDEKNLPTIIIDRLIVESYTPPPKSQFFLSTEQVHALIKQAKSVFAAEPTLIELQVPVKVYGDIHGQFGDLQRLFGAYGTPEHKIGDISVYRYLFIGDFVDRGPNSLEVMCLLLALKCRYPGRVYLIRGNHEDKGMNRTFGFMAECKERFQSGGEDIWNAFADLFCYLPLAVRIDKRILCLHGGIGKLKKISQIAEVKRPIDIDLANVGKSTDNATTVDCLWSDPAENDTEVGYVENVVRRVSVVFGADTVKKFCKENDLDLIIRAHQCVKEGFEYFADGHLITVFSATNYCGRDQNAGALLDLVEIENNEIVVTPKSIAPTANSSTTWRVFDKSSDPTSPMRKPAKSLSSSLTFLNLN